MSERAKMFLAALLLFALTLAMMGAWEIGLRISEARP
jgi:hypothetical protein